MPTYFYKVVRKHYIKFWSIFFKISRISLRKCFLSSTWIVIYVAGKVFNSTLICYSSPRINSAFLCSLCFLNLRKLSKIESTEMHDNVVLKKILVIMSLFTIHLVVVIFNNKKWFYTSFIWKLVFVMLLKWSIFILLWKSFLNDA